MHTHAHTSAFFSALRQRSCALRPSLSQAQIISDVAAASPAHSLGLVAGDAILTINGQGAAQIDAQIDVLELVISGDMISYQVYAPKRQVILDFEMAGLPLGVRVRASTATIIDHYDAYGYDDHNGFYSLWEREDYASILEICDIIEQSQYQGMFGRLLGRKNDVPAIELMRNICALEMQEESVVGEHFEEFVKNKASDLPANVQALGYFYLANLAKQKSDILYYQEYMREAYKLNPSSNRITRATKAAGLSIQKTPALLGRQLPDHYKFKILNSKGKPEQEIDFAELLSAARPNQVIPLCFMPDCRANSEYNQALKAYRAMGRYVGKDFTQMMVITNKRKPQDKAETRFLQQEQQALAGGVPVTILWEETVGFLRDLGLKKAPVFLVVNPHGRVVWADGLSDSYDYWTLLASLRKGPRNAAQTGAPKKTFGTRTGPEPINWQPSRVSLARKA